MTSPLAARLLADTERELAELALSPGSDLEQFLLLSLEREQVAAIAYSEDLVIHRLQQLDVTPEVTELLRRVILWVQRDEALHSQYLRGLLVRTRKATPLAFVFARQFVGSVSGWVSAVRHHKPPSHLGVRNLLAAAAIHGGKILGRIPDGLENELRYMGFRHYCEVNHALELTAVLSYEHLLPLLTDPEQSVIFERILADELRHADVFELLVEAFDDNDQLLMPYPDLVERIGEISPWFLPGDLRPGAAEVTSSLGRGSTVHVARGDDKCVALDEAIAATGLESLVRERPRSIVIHAAFMLGYHRDDPSTVLHPELLHHLALRLREWGAQEVIVQEAGSVYDRFYAHRSVHEVAEYFGFSSPHYRIVDVADELVEMEFARGFVASRTSRVWRDASLRIVFAKLMGDPSELAHAAMATTCRIGERTDAHLFTNKMVDHRTAALMTLDVCPPDFAIIDAWAPIADGPLGVMGSASPSAVRRIYAGEDALSVDAALFADMGFDDPSIANSYRQADAWFGRSSRPTQITGQPGPMPEYRAPRSGLWFRFVSATADPIYLYFSDSGRWFTPEFDTDAFPELDDPGIAVRTVRRATRQVFGLHPPR